MTKPLQTKKRKLPGGIPAVRLLQPLALPAVVSVMLSMNPIHVFGQGGTHAGEEFVRDNNRTVSAAAAEAYYSGEELRRLHPTDLLRALELIDPAINGTDPGERNGSNPNAVVSGMNLQGVQSLSWGLSDAGTMPLVIVDGHSESIGRLQDFDMQRVESVTLLKNASATALYGLRGGHGVIVIKTKVPENEKLRLTYNFDGSFQRASLRSFDLMDANRKLAWEKSMGAYDGNDALYQQRMADVKANGSTDWLEMPLRTSFSHRHRVSVDGGDSSLRYRGVIYMNPAKGVMKGSKRTMYGASAFIGYTTRALQISNELSVDMADASESNYAPMYRWAQMNPYYAAADERGVPYDILGEGTFSEQQSPLYESSLNSFAENKISRVNNSLTLRWRIDPHFSVAGQFNLTHDYDKRSEFTSPMSLIYKDYTLDEIDQKGSYRILRNRLECYQEKVWADYRLERERHTLRASLGMEVYSATMTDDAFRGVGMSSDHMDYISFAQRYAPQRPEGAKTFERVLSGYGIVSWSLDGTLFVDLAGRVDKSSMLAPEKRTAGSYSLTAAYDLKKALLGDSELIGRLTVTAGYGSTAGYQFDYAFANPVYAYDIDNPYLNGMGENKNNIDYRKGLVTFYNTNAFNPALKWKTTRNVNVGVNGRISTVDLSVRYYNTLSKNILTLDEQNVAFGSGYRYTNGGAIRNSGLEFSAAAGILRDRSGVDLTIFAKGVVNRSKITELPDYSATAFNTDVMSAALTNSDVLGNRFYYGMAEGDAADGIYALRSAGIDPATGQELYYLRDGSKSPAATAQDRVYMGSMTPKLRGTFGVTAAYRSIDFAAVFAYSLGGKFYDLYTQQFTDLAGYADNVPVSAGGKWSPSNKNAAYQGVEHADSGFASSRFVTTRNTLSLASLRIGYAFPKRIASAMRMQALKVSLTCDDLWYSSSVKSPRSLYYPYASSFILSLQATF